MDDGLPQGPTRALLLFGMSTRTRSIPEAVIRVRSWRFNLVQIVDLSFPAEKIIMQLALIHKRAMKFFSCSIPIGSRILPLVRIVHGSRRPQTMRGCESGT